MLFNPLHEVIMATLLEEDGVLSFVNQT